MSQLRYAVHRQKAPCVALSQVLSLRSVYTHDRHSTKTVNTVMILTQEV